MEEYTVSDNVVSGSQADYNASSDNSTDGKKGLGKSDEAARDKSFQDMTRKVLRASGNKQDLGALGWRADINVRKKGKSAGTRDVTYIDPITNKKFSVI